MTDFLSSLSQGLRTAGGALSGDAFGAEQRSRLQEQELRSRRQDLVAGVLFKGIESGAIDPDTGNQALQKLGYPAAGPSAATQQTSIENADKNRAQQLQAASDQELKAITEEYWAMAEKSDALGASRSRVDPTGALEIEADDTQLDVVRRISKRMAQSANPVSQKWALDRLKQVHDIEAQKAIKNAQFVELATGNKTADGKHDMWQKFRVQADGSLKPEGGEYSKGALSEVNVNNYPEKPLPEAAQKTMSGARSMWSALQTVKHYIGRSGVVQGWISKGGAALGTDKGAIEFQTAVDNMRVTAQDVIKGIPSNFDVQTFIQTLPSLTNAESVNASRVAYTERALRQLMKDSIAYYKGVNINVPQHIVDDARAMGVDLDDVKPWKGSTDPLADTGRVVAGLSSEGEPLEPGHSGNAPADVQSDLKRMEEEMRRRRMK